MRAGKEDLNFHQLIVNDPEIGARVSRARIERAFDLKRQLKNIDKIFARVFPGKNGVQNKARASRKKSKPRK